MIEMLLLILTGILSVNIVGIASSNGYLEGAFSRSFAGIGTQLTSATYLTQYTTFETFIYACAQGYVGLAGYIFIASLIFLGIVWITNLIEYRQVIM